MAAPIKFPESNDILKAPTGQEDEVLDLHIHRYTMTTPGIPLCPIVMSCWQLSHEELKEIINNGGKIWFNCFGNTHPPMWLTSINPFKPEGS